MLVHQRVCFLLFSAYSDSNAKKRLCDFVHVWKTDENRVNQRHFIKNGTMYIDVPFCIVLIAAKPFHEKVLVENSENWNSAGGDEYNLQGPLGGQNLPQKKLWRK